MDNWAYFFGKGEKDKGRGAMDGKRNGNGADRNKRRNGSNGDNNNSGEWFRSVRLVSPVSVNDGDSGADDGGKDGAGGGREEERRRQPLLLTTRHFNVLFEGYAQAHRTEMLRKGWEKRRTSGDDGDDDEDWVINNGDSNEGNDLDTDKYDHDDDDEYDGPSEGELAHELLDVMLLAGVPLDGFSVSSLMTLQSTSAEVTALWTRAAPETTAELSPAAYRSIVAAYGRAGDPSSACAAFREAGRRLGHRARTVECWNALLGALAKGATFALEAAEEAAVERMEEEGNNEGGNEAGEGADGASVTTAVINVASSGAAQAFEVGTDGVEDFTTALVNGKTCIAASMSIVDAMAEIRSHIDENDKIVTTPRPNSQSFCLVASALANSGSDDPDVALALFRKAVDAGAASDGRFLNAVLRCFGGDVDSAVEAWKDGIGRAAAAAAKAAAAASDSRRRGSGSGSGGDTPMKDSANLLAAYHGLLHVCGRALRPDVALRIAYAMEKAGIEPTEMALNCYNAGKAKRRDDASGGRMTEQYESLLSVECTKYSEDDKRRSGDKRIRIIL